MTAEAALTAVRPPAAREGLPPPARLFILIVAAVGLTELALLAPRALAWSTSDVLAWAVLTAGIVLAEGFPVSLKYGDESEDFLMTDVLFAAGLLLATPAVLMCAVAVGAFTGNTIRRKPVHKTAFNVGLDLTGIGVAEVVYSSFSRVSPVTPVAWLGAALGMAAYATVNEIGMALILSFAGRLRFVSVLTGPIRLSVLQWGGNVAIGIMAGAMIASIPSLLPLLLVPLALSILAYRGRLEGLLERDRMRGLYEAGRVLFGPLHATPDFRSFLPLAARVLKASEAEVVVLDGERVVAHDEEGAVTVTRGSRRRSRRPSPEAYVRPRPGLLAHTAMSGEQMGSASALTVYREKPLTEAEQALANALASQVGMRIQNCQLFSETLDQRVQLSEIIANATDGIVAVAPDGTILSWNPAMERITGVPVEEALQTTWTALFDGAESKDEPSSAGRQDGPAAFQDMLFVRRDGARRWVRYTSSSMPDRDDRQGGAVIVARDVTAELEAEQAKSDFVATISHELRTPLTPLKGFLTALASGTIDDTAETRGEYYRIMLKQAERLEHLVADLLQSVTVEAEPANDETRTVELTSLASERAAEALPDGADHELVLRMPGVPVIALADPFRVEQVLGNLLSNAIKFSPPGTRVEVAVSMTATEAVVSVRDEGRGIPLADKDRVFERFYRVETGTVRETQGAGLGLYIAKQLVEAMNGRIWVDSGLGTGSRFSFSFPLTNGSASIPPAMRQK